MDGTLSQQERGQALRTGEESMEFPGQFVVLDSGPRPESTASFIFHVDGNANMRSDELPQAWKHTLSVSMTAAGTPPDASIKSANPAASSPEAWLETSQTLQSGPLASVAAGAKCQAAGGDNGCISNAELLHLEGLPVTLPAPPSAPVALSRPTLGEPVHQKVRLPASSSPQASQILVRPVPRASIAGASRPKSLAVDHLRLAYQGLNGGRPTQPLASAPSIERLPGTAQSTFAALHLNDSLPTGPSPPLLENQSEQPPKTAPLASASLSAGTATCSRLQVRGSGPCSAPLPPCCPVSPDNTAWPASEPPAGNHCPSLGDFAQVGADVVSGRIPCSGMALDDPFGSSSPRLNTLQAGGEHANAPYEYALAPCPPVPQHPSVSLAGFAAGGSAIHMTRPQWPSFSSTSAICNLGKSQRLPSASSASTAQGSYSLHTASSPDTNYCRAESMGASRWLLGDWVSQEPCSSPSPLSISKRELKQARSGRRYPAISLRGDRRAGNDNVNSSSQCSSPARRRRQPRSHRRIAAISSTSSTSRHNISTKGSGRGTSSDPPEPRKPSALSGQDTGAGLDFVNLTPADRGILMAGVAPSGSGKTKARREREAAERHRRLNEALVRAVAAAGGNVNQRALEEARSMRAMIAVESGGTSTPPPPKTLLCYNT